MQHPHPSLAARRFHPAARSTWAAHLRRATSWVAAGSVAATLALIGLAAHETPPHRTTGTTGSTGVAGSSSTGGADGATTPIGGTGTPASGGSTGATGGGSSTTGTGTPGAASTSGSVIGPSSGGSPHVSTGLS